MNALTFNTSPGFYYRVWVHAIASDGRFTGADYRWFHVTAPATPTPIPLPDLAITALTANPSSPQVGQQVTISYSAKNLSGSSVPGRRIRIYIDPVGNPPMPSTTPWKESVVAITWPVGDVQSGSWTHTFTSAKTYEVYAKVDPLNVISESNENNNLQYLGVVVVAAPTATPTRTPTPVPPTATPTNTPVPAPVIDIREQYERHSKPYTLIKSTYIATVANLQRRDICTPQEIRFSVKATTAADSTYQRSTTAVITQNTTNKNIFTVTDIFQSSGAKTIKITCEKGSSVVASGTKALTIGDYTTAAPHIASQSVAASGQGAVLSWTV